MLYLSPRAESHPCLQGEEEGQETRWFAKMEVAAAGPPLPLSGSQPAGRLQVVVAVRGVVRRVGRSGCAFQGCGGNRAGHSSLLGLEKGPPAPGSPSPGITKPSRLPRLTCVCRQVGALLGGLSVVVVPPLRPLPFCPRPQGDGAVAVEGDCKAGRLRVGARCAGSFEHPPARWAQAPAPSRGLSKSGSRSPVASPAESTPHR